MLSSLLVLLLVLTLFTKMSGDPMRSHDLTVYTLDQGPVSGSRFSKTLSLFTLKRGKLGFLFHKGRKVKPQKEEKLQPVS